MTKPELKPSKSGAKLWPRLLGLGVLIAVTATVYWLFGDQLSLQFLAEQEERLRQLQADAPVLVFGLALVVYVVVTGLSVPGATGLTLVYAWFFDFWPALLLISFASTSGATVAFLLSRYLLGTYVQNRFGRYLEGFNQQLETEGAFYLFTLRLVPLVPFFVINAVMGLTKLRTVTFWWVSQLGMLPGTCLYVYAGSQVPDLKTLAEKGAEGILTPQLIIAFVMLGVFPLLIKKLVEWIRGDVTAQPPSGG